MTDEEALLQAAIEDHDENAPRLVFADWLEEQGREERAEFIRVQCEQAKLADADPRQKGLRQRERELLAAHQEE